MTMLMLIDMLMTIGLFVLAVAVWSCGYVVGKAVGRNGHK